MISMLDYSPKSDFLQAIEVSSTRKSAKRSEFVDEIRAV
jgi:hypothetical protein